jgi:hypothetical protein
MSAIKDETLAEIDTAWKALQDTLARVPRGWIEEPGVVERWSVKDLIGHVTTWENEAIKSLRAYTAQGDVEALAWPDVDALNERTVAAKRNNALTDMRLDSDETHRRLIQLVKALSPDEFTVPEIENRIRVDTFAHYAEHTEHIAQWLERTD